MFIVDNDFISTQEQEEFRESLLSLSSWSFMPTTTTVRNDGGALPSSFDSFQFVSSITPSDPMFKKTMGIAGKFFDKHGVDAKNKELYRLKSNILTRQLSSEHHLPHIDRDAPHLVFLYYVNDSDGDTVFFDKFWQQGVIPKVDDLNEALRISPKMGTGILFDGLQYHASSSPVESLYRCVINLTFEK
jgi:hypothetical protein